MGQRKPLGPTSNAALPQAGQLLNTSENDPPLVIAPLNDSAVAQVLPHLPAQKGKAGQVANLGQ